MAVGSSDKFIVVDETWLLMGGRNLGDRYYAPNGYHKAITNDRDVLVWRENPHIEEDGSVLHQAVAHMDQLWESGHTLDVAGKDAGKMLEERQSLLGSMAFGSSTTPLSTGRLRPG